MKKNGCQYFFQLIQLSWQKLEGVTNSEKFSLSRNLDTQRHQPLHGEDMVFMHLINSKDRANYINLQRQGEPQNEHGGIQISPQISCALNCNHPIHSLVSE
jgi:hypothetical protein